MLIQVLWKDNSYDYVHDFHLEDLIRRGEVQGFFRPYSNEWVNIKDNPIRKSATVDYDGPERRFKMMFVHDKCRRG